MPTILYPERMYDTDTEERRIHGEGTTILFRDTKTLADLSDEDCARGRGPHAVPPVLHRSRHGPHASAARHRPHGRGL